MKKSLFVILAICLPMVIMSSCSSDDDDNESNGSVSSSDLTGVVLQNSYYNIDDDGYPEEWTTTLTFTSSSSGKYYCHGSSYALYDSWKKEYFTQNYNFTYKFDGKVLNINVLGDGAWASQTLYYVNGYFAETSDGKGAIWTKK